MFFFKTEDETEDELRLMGYHRLLTVYPTAHPAAGAALEPAELGEVFLEAGSSPGRDRRLPVLRTPPEPRRTRTRLLAA